MFCILQSLNAFLPLRFAMWCSRVTTRLQLRYRCMWLHEKGKRNAYPLFEILSLRRVVYNFSTLKTSHTCLRASFFPTALVTMALKIYLSIDLVITSTFLVWWVKYAHISSHRSEINWNGRWENDTLSLILHSSKLRKHDFPLEYATHPLHSAYAFGVCGDIGHFPFP